MEEACFFRVRVVARGEKEGAAVGNVPIAHHGVRRLEGLPVQGGACETMENSLPYLEGHSCPLESTEVALRRLENPIVL